MAFESLTDTRIKSFCRCEACDESNSRATWRMRITSAGTILSRARTARNGSNFLCARIRPSRMTFHAGCNGCRAGGESLIVARYNGVSHEHPNKIEADKGESCLPYPSNDRTLMQANLKSARLRGSGACEV